MAFRAAPMGLHHIATTTSEAAPAVMDVLRSSWRRTVKSTGLGSGQKTTTAQRDAPEQSIARQHGHMVVASMRMQRQHLSSRACPSTAAGSPGMQRRPFSSMSPLDRSLSSASRSLSTASSRASLVQRSKPTASVLGFNQHRTLFGNAFGSQTNHNHLAHMEQVANNNPGSPTAQNAFYQALLRANMPEIIVERYNTGRYATNPSVDQVYNKALERTEATAGLGGYGTANVHAQAAPNNQVNHEQLQAIAHAVAAKNQGGNISVSRPGTGAKAEPLYVVVEESIGKTIFKWVKFLLGYGLLVYCTIVMFTIIIEGTGLLKKVPGSQNAEAKPELQTTKFSDVHGCDEAKEELQELVEFLKAPEKFGTLGGKLPKGVLLVGPPGTGKTLLARAVAGEAQVPFFYMSGSEFDEVYVGVGAKRVRDLFNAARAKSPAIIFIDELDAIGGKRHERDAAYAKQTLNQLLTELDGFDQSSGVIIIGATNFPESLDKALTRPGRFDRNVAVPLPDVRGRVAILKHHLKNIRVDTTVDASVIARGCPGFSGAELENIVNQAAVHASKNKKAKVDNEDLVWAKDKILLGAERRSAVIQEKDKLMTAYHESGHALVAMLTQAAAPLYKATIMPRGHALGITFQLPEMDKVSESKKELLAKIDVSMGGKVAEELVYGPDEVTTGASSDIQNATNVALHMVTRAGMSDKLGNIDLASDYNRLSSETKQEIEREVRRLVEEGRERATKLLTANRESLNRLAKALLEYETLNKEEMEKIVRGESLPDKMKVDPRVPIKTPEARPESSDPFPSPIGGGTGLGAPPNASAVERP